MAAAPPGETQAQAIQRVQEELAANDARREKIAMHTRLENPLIMGRPYPDEALQQRDSFLAERGGISSLQPGDAIDPDGDRLILAEFKRLNLVPNDADGNSAEHWGHTEAGDEDDGREESHPHAYGRLLTNQYEKANRRYLKYHDRTIRRLEEAVRGPPAWTPSPRGARVPIQRTITRRRGGQAGTGMSQMSRPPMQTAQMLPFEQSYQTGGGASIDHRGASAAQQVIAGSGRLPAPPGYHYMSTGVLMKDPD